MQTHSNGVDHLRADCSGCGSYIKYCAQYDDPPPRWSPRATVPEGYNTQPSRWLLTWEALGAPRQRKL